jgi:hypothetical protein
VEAVDEHGNVVAVQEAFEPGTPTLQEVTKRDGKKKIPPPDSHLGKAISPKPIVAATLGLHRLAALAR